jgi:hypothetical protein
MIPVNESSYSQREKIKTLKESSFEAFEVFTWGKDYPNKWRELINGGKGYAGFNFWACILGCRWYFFRKLPVQGTIFLILESIIIISWYIGLVKLKLDGMLVSSVLTALMISLMIFNGFIANQFYFKKVNSAVKDLVSSNVPEKDFGEILRFEGGTSLGAFIFASAVTIFLKTILNSFGL